MFSFFYTSFLYLILLSSYSHSHIFLLMHFTAALAWFFMFYCVISFQISHCFFYYSFIISIAAEIAKDSSSNTYLSIDFSPMIIFQSIYKSFMHFFCKERKCNGKVFRTVLPIMLKSMNVWSKIIEMLGFFFTWNWNR